MTAATTHPSFFEQLTRQKLNPIWSIRIMTGIALLTAAMALWVVKSGNWHSFLLGATVGMLAGVLLQACNTRADETYSVPQPSDVDDLRVTGI